MIYGVLAGGKSSRMGTDKSFLTFGGKFVLEFLLERFGKEKVYLSSARGDVGQRLKHLLELPEEIADRVADAGPAGGIYSLLETLGEGVFVVATDMPFADVRLARCIMALGQEPEQAAVRCIMAPGQAPEQAEARCIMALGQEPGQAAPAPDMIVLEHAGGRREMLFGYYGVGCLKPLKEMLSEKNYRLRNLCDRVNCRVVTQEQAACAYGPGCERALFNMNTPGDYEIALKMAGQYGSSCDCPK